MEMYYKKRKKIYALGPTPIMQTNLPLISLQYANAKQKRELAAKVKLFHSSLIPKLGVTVISSSNLASLILLPCVWYFLSPPLPHHFYFLFQILSAGAPARRSPRE